MRNKTVVLVFFNVKNKQQSHIILFLRCSCGEIILLLLVVVVFLFEQKMQRGRLVAISEAQMKRFNRKNA